MRRHSPLVADFSELLPGRRTRNHESVHAHPFAKIDAKVGLEQCLVLDGRRGCSAGGKLDKKTRP